MGIVMATSVFVARLRGARCWTGYMQFANNLRLLLAIKINFIISVCLSGELKSEGEGVTSVFRSRLLAAACRLSAARDLARCAADVSQNLIHAQVMSPRVDRPG